MSVENYRCNGWRFRIGWDFLVIQQEKYADPQSFANLERAKPKNSKKYHSSKGPTNIFAVAASGSKFCSLEKMCYLLFMPESHIFPILEPDLHIESEKCECIPVKEEDKNTGEIRWIHKPLIIDDIVGRLEML